MFYIEGGATIAVAICAMFILPNFPHNTRWLTPEERSLAISRLENDGTGRIDGPGKRTTVQGLWDALSDWKVWWFAVALIIDYMVLSFVIYFPTIVATMGYDTTVTLLLAAPPWVLATIGAFTLSRSVKGSLLSRIASHGRSGTLIERNSVSYSFLHRTH
jgi:hypothetical protein